GSGASLTKKYYGGIWASVRLALSPLPDADVSLGASGCRLGVLMR
ncbi:hypothetical protein cypCar_00029543, partial [Cyprinus carpio]